MKYFIYVMNCFIVILIPIAFVLTPVKEEKNKVIDTEIAVRQLSSEDMIENSVMEPAKEATDEEERSNDENSEEENEKVVKVSDQKEISTDKKEETSSVSVSPKVEEQPKSDVLETQTGKMSGYGPDCAGCSGYLASGRYVGNGNVSYYDSTYGNVRIVAGDYKYQFGTIIRVKNSRAGSFLAIVLDRGGSIGFGKKFLFDLLYSSESAASHDEVSYNVTFEVLRYGY